jgi:hypothetical protein
MAEKKVDELPKTEDREHSTIEAGAGAVNTCRS